MTTTNQLLRQAPSPARELLRALISAQVQHNLFLPDQPTIVAVSGGADSMSLLHALHQLAPLWGLSLHVAHLDHALRPESAEEAEFVAAFARRLKLPCYTTRLTPGILEDDPQGLEAAARSARLRFLRQFAGQVREQAGAPVTIATAHHQDDQAETLLLHLIQGSGLTGLAGMAWVGELPDGQQPPIRLVRPLLGVSRNQIRAYLDSYGIEWREDRSNLDLAYLRNQLRHQVLPLLATINPNIHATLARTADLLAAEADHANRRDRAALAEVTQIHTPSTRIVLDWFQLARHDLATRRGVLRQALLALGVDLRAVGMEAIDTLLAQAQPAATSGPHPLAEGWAWTLFYHTKYRFTGQSEDSPAGQNDKWLLSLHRASALPYIPEHPHLAAPLTTPIALPSEGTITHNNWQLQSGLITPDELPADWRSRKHPWRLFCDANNCGDLYLTTYQPGMVIAPLGMEGHTRALGDIFTDHKIPPFLRPGWPVVINDGGMVVWLCGLIVSEHIRVHPTTRQVRRLLWQQEGE